MPRALRIIVMRDGKVIDDRPLEAGAAVSIGASALNTFRVPGTGLPDSVTLLDYDGPQPVLHVLDGMGGEIALDGVTPSSLLMAGPERTIALPESTRGWVSIGGTTFFIQQTSAPASKPKNVLPKEVRGGWLSGIESRFALVLVGVLSLEGIGVAAINRRPAIEPEQIAEPDVLGTVVTIPVVEDPPPKHAPEHSSEKPQSGRGRGTVKPTAHPGPTAAEHAHQAVLDILGGGASDDPLEKVVNQSAPDLVGIEEALRHAVPRIASSGEMFGPRRGGGPSGPADADDPIGDPGAPPRRPIALPPRNPPPPVVILDPLGPPVQPPPGFDPDDLVKFIKRHMGTIKSCYDRELKSDPTLRGRIAMRFTVASSGRFTEVAVEQNTMQTEAVGSCLTRLMQSWMLTSRPEDEFTVTFPFVFAPGG